MLTKELDGGLGFGFLKVARLLWKSVLPTWGCTTSENDIIRSGPKESIELIRIAVFVAAHGS